MQLSQKISTKKPNPPTWCSVFVIKVKGLSSNGRFYNIILKMFVCICVQLNFQISGPSNSSSHIDIYHNHTTHIKFHFHHKFTAKPYNEITHTYSNKYFFKFPIKFFCLFFLFVKTSFAAFICLMTMTVKMKQ